MIKSVKEIIQKINFGNVLVDLIPQFSVEFEECGIFHNKGFIMLFYNYIDRSVDVEIDFGKMRKHFTSAQYLDCVEFVERLVQQQQAGEI